MKKIIIDGGDNGYCARSNSLADRCVLVLDTKEKTIRYANASGICLCKHCFYPKELDLGDGRSWYLFRDEIIHFNSRGRMSHRYKYYAEDITDTKLSNFEHNPEKQIPVTVKGNKWGKDCEFGVYGSAYGADTTRDIYGSKVIELVRFRKDREKEYWGNYDARSEKPNDYWFEKTGWKLVIPPKESLCD